ncbi:tyrosine-type recombinase/integrase [Paenibacillus physcomitrellae]|nr:tyrosine-type recombinase/integrase [Paenibacillus physcomitrellae]
MFRHTFCTRLLKKGLDPTAVSKLAGHSPRFNRLMEEATVFDSKNSC